MFSHDFEIFIPYLTISFHEVTAHVSLNAATHEQLHLKYLEQLHFFWKFVHAFHRK